MIWLYERAGEVVQVETRFDESKDMYQLVIKWPDGQERREEHADLDGFRRRLTRLSVELGEQQWIRNGPPILLPDGWRKPPAQ